MSYQTPLQFSTVTVTCKANVYFDGKVVSHSLSLADGSRKSIGLVYPGSFVFNTEAAERMEIISGLCRVRIVDGDWHDYAAGSYFDVPAKAYFEIAVSEGIVEYVCSFA